jgi:UDP-N-acetylglucosamine 4-epimerase
MQDCYDALLSEPKTWLVTGAAGFIGSNLIETLLRYDQLVVGVDNFVTGHKKNLDGALAKLDAAQRNRFTFVEGTIENYETCLASVQGVDVCLHQAALGSVPRSILNPLATNASNVTGFLNMLNAAKDAGVPRFVFAASSSSYGDSRTLPKVESEIGRPLSPYAVTKYVNELYAEVFSRIYGITTVGLRYFNVFGRRQDPDGEYAAVIPKWIGAMLKGEQVQINGDGTTSRDFCHIENAVQANILAACKTIPDSHQIYNVAVGAQTSLIDLYDLLKSSLQQNGFAYDIPPVFADFRPGDVKHSKACINKAVSQLSYKPSHDIVAGIRESIQWYIDEESVEYRA